MELFDNLATGFSVAFTLSNLAYAFIGCLLGTLIGVLPGIGPLATIAMLLPATYSLAPVSALIMLAGIYYGAQYGGSTTAILVNLPGESSSVVTVIDGYQMARKGRAGPALAAAGLGSFFAGCVGTLVLAAFAVPLTEVALAFSSAEYFALMVLGLVGAVVLASGSLIKAVSMIILGLLLGLIGTDVMSGTYRFTFDIPELTDGIGFMSSLSPMVACILLVLTASANPRLGWVITFKCHLLYIQIVPFRVNVICCSKHPCGCACFFHIQCKQYLFRDHFLDGRYIKTNQNVANGGTILFDHNTLLLTNIVKGWVVLVNSRIIGGP